MGIFGGDSDNSSGDGGGEGGDTQSWVQMPFDAEFVVPLKGGGIENMTRLSLTTLAEGEHAAFGFYFNGGFVNLEDGSSLEIATRSASTFGVGLAFRYYFLATNAPFNPYVGTRLGWQSMSWTSVDGVSMDHLSGLDSFAGVGVTWHKDHPFSFFGEIGIGGNVFGGTTFGDYPYFAVKGGVSFRFGQRAQRHGDDFHE